MSRCLRLITCLSAVLALAGCRGPAPDTTDQRSAAPSPVAPAPPPAEGGDHIPAPTARAPAGARNKWGVHLLLDDGVSQWPGERWEQHFAHARRLVGRGGYVVELIRANDLDERKWQRFLDLAARYELQPILRLATWQDAAAGHWIAPPPDPEGTTYRRIAARFADFVRALRPWAPLLIAVGNEPNRGDEWGGEPNPAAYARYLLDVSAALHEAAPGRVRVLNGALDPYAPNTGSHALNGFRAYDAAGFLDGMHSAHPQVWQAIDGWATHAYPLGPFSEHPAARSFHIDDLSGDAEPDAPPWPGLYNRGLNSYQWELYRLRAFGVRRPLDIFITETGWRHARSQRVSRDTTGAARGSDEVARFVQLAFDGDRLLDNHEYTWTPWNADPAVQAVALFALAGDPSRWGHTNLVELSPEGEIVGFRPELLPLLKP